MRRNPHLEAHPKPWRPGANPHPLTSARLLLCGSLDALPSFVFSQPRPRRLAPSRPRLRRLAPSNRRESPELQRVRTPRPWEPCPATLDVMDYSTLDWLFCSSGQFHLPPVVAGSLLDARASCEFLKSWYYKDPQGLPLLFYRCRNLSPGKGRDLCSITYWQS